MFVLYLFDTHLAVQLRAPEAETWVASVITGPQMTPKGWPRTSKTGVERQEVWLQLCPFKWEVKGPMLLSWATSQFVRWRKSLWNWLVLFFTFFSLFVHCAGQRWPATTGVCSAGTSYIWQHSSRWAGSRVGGSLNRGLYVPPASLKLSRHCWEKLRYEDLFPDMNGKGSNQPLVSVETRNKTANSIFMPLTPAWKFLLKMCKAYSPHFSECNQLPRDRRNILSLSPWLNLNFISRKNAVCDEITSPLLVCCQWRRW